MIIYVNVRFKLLKCLGFDNVAGTAVMVQQKSFICNFTLERMRVT